MGGGVFFRSTGHPWPIPRSILDAIRYKIPPTHILARERLHLIVCKVITLAKRCFWKITLAKGLFCMILVSRFSPSRECFYAKSRQHFAWPSNSRRGLLHMAPNIFMSSQYLCEFIKICEIMKICYIVHGILML